MYLKRECVWGSVVEGDVVIHLRGLKRRRFVSSYNITLEGLKFPYLFYIKLDSDEPIKRNRKRMSLGILSVYRALSDAGVLQRTTGVGVSQEVCLWFLSRRPSPSLRPAAVSATCQRRALL